MDTQQANVTRAEPKIAGVTDAVQHTGCNFHVRPLGTEQTGGTPAWVPGVPLGARRREGWTGRPLPLQRSGRKERPDPQGGVRRGGPFHWSP